MIKIIITSTLYHAVYLPPTHSTISYCVGRKTDSFKKLPISGQSVSAAFNTLVHSFINSQSINAVNLFSVICEMPNLRGKAY
jgi:hypothetical protein